MLYYQKVDYGYIMGEPAEMRWWGGTADMKALFLTNSTEEDSFKVVTPHL